METNQKLGWEKFKKGEIYVDIRDNQFIHKICVDEIEELFIETKCLSEAYKIREKIISWDWF